MNNQPNNSSFFSTNQFPQNNNNLNWNNLYHQDILRLYPYIDYKFDVLYRNIEFLNNNINILNMKLTNLIENKNNNYRNFNNKRNFNNNKNNRNNRIPIYKRNNRNNTIYKRVPNNSKLKDDIPLDNIVIKIDDIVTNNKNNSKKNTNNRIKVGTVGQLNPLGLFASLFSKLGKNKTEIETECESEDNDDEISEYCSDDEFNELNMDINNIDDLLKISNI